MAYALPFESAQLTVAPVSQEIAATMKLPAVLAAPKAWAMVVALALLVLDAVCTKETGVVVLLIFKGMAGLVAVWLAASRATAVKTWAPFVAVLVFHWRE